MQTLTSASTLSSASELESLFTESPELDIGVHDYNINVTSNDGETIPQSEVLHRYAQFDGAGRDAHLYFHLPLCDYICHFCNYVKTRIRSKEREADLTFWVNLLISESRRSLQLAPWLSAARIRSFYIGGGTGALLLNNRSAIERLIAHVRQHYDVSACSEWTIEGNPENFTQQNLELALDLGFNRFSVGVQSLQNEVNDFANRGHSADEARRAIDVLLHSGKPFSVDMMFGLPFQTCSSTREEIAWLARSGVPAITIYRLRNSEREKMGIGNASVWNTPRIKQNLDQRGVLPSVLETYRMRDQIVEVLLEHGYHPSPCGWWNRTNTYPEGNIPRVSKDKWEQYNTMIAHGPGAYGWLTGNETEFCQTHNLTKIGEYAKAMQDGPGVSALSHGRVLREQTAVATKLAFAFKANQPISVAAYLDLFGVRLLEDEPYRSVLHTMIARGFLQCTQGGAALQPTLKGEMVHEEIMFVYFHRMIGASAKDVRCKLGGSPPAEISA